MNQGMMRPGALIRCAVPMAACCLLLLIFSGCASSERSSLKADTGGAIITEKKEIDLGKAVAQEVLREYSAYEDRDVNEYVNRIGQAVARISDRSNIPYHFTVLDHPVVNAFAAPGGYVFVTRGLLSAVKNEAQLAAILGHEVAHVVERHAMKRLQAQAATMLAQIAGAVKGMGGREISATQDMATLIFLGYDREAEYHADALGVKYASAAGYDPKEMLVFFETLKGEQESAGIGQPSSVQELVWDHPPTAKRKENTRQAIENLKLWDAAGGIRHNAVIGSGEFAAVIAGHSFKEEEAQIDKVFTLIYTAYQAEDVDKLMSHVSRDYSSGTKTGYYDLEKDLRFFFTNSDQIHVETKKKDIRLKEAKLGFVNHEYAEKYFDRAKNEEVRRSVKERLWFAKKESRWFLTGVENNPK